MYVCKELGTMQIHAGRSHGWRKAMGATWSDCQIQTWFHGAQLKYFKVGSSVETLPSSHQNSWHQLLEALKKEERDREIKEEEELMKMSREPKLDKRQGSLCFYY